MKTCSGCDETKPFEEFSRKKSAKDGLRSQCRACSSAAYRRYREENRDKVQARAARYYSENREKVGAYRSENRERIRATNRAYYEKEQERIRARERARRAANREARKAYDREYARLNKEALRERARQYREANRERLAEQKRRYYESNRDRLLKTGRRRPDPLSRAGYIYRLFDADDRLLYVGLTYNVTNRFFRDRNNHSAFKPWWSAVAFCWVEEFETYADAQEEERHAYAEEAPLMNRAPLYPTGPRPSPVAGSEYSLELRDFV